MADIKNFTRGLSDTDSESELPPTLPYQTPVQTKDTGATQRPSAHVSGLLQPVVESSPSSEGDKEKYSAPVQEEGKDRNMKTTMVLASFNPSPMMMQSTNARKSSKKLCGVLTVIMLVAVTVVALVAGGLSSVSQQPTDFDVAIYQGDTIILDRRKIFWYSEVTITELSTPEDDHDVDVFIEQCSTLQNFVHTSTVSNQSRDLSVHEAVVTIVENMYLLSSSNVSLIIQTWDAHQSNSTVPKLCVFDDKTSFDHFVSDNAIECFPTNISHSSAHSYTRIDYIFPKNSYYYIGITFGSALPLTLQYNYTLWQRSYNHSDFTPPDCTVTTTTDCRIPFSLAKSLDDAEECLLAYTEVPEFAENEYVNLHKHLKRRILNTLSISLLVLAVFILGIFLLVCFVKNLYMYMCCKKRCCTKYSPVPSDNE